jgi:RNA polymerase sigma factor (sigma-70 family)
VDDENLWVRNEARSERIEKAAASLSALERDVLSLSSHDGLRNNEIAELLGIRERRVERLLARAVLKFDRALCSKIGSPAGDASADHSKGD